MKLSCACGEIRTYYKVYSSSGFHSQSFCYSLHEWVEDADSWYAREVERMAGRAPA